MKQDPRDEILVEYPDGRKFRWRYNPNTVDTVLKKTPQVTHFLTSVSGGYPVQSAYFEPTPQHVFADTSPRALIAAARDPVPTPDIQDDEPVDSFRAERPHSQTTDSSALAKTTIIHPNNNLPAYIWRSINHPIPKQLLFGFVCLMGTMIVTQELLTVSNRCYPLGYWTRVQLLNNIFSKEKLPFTTNCPPPKAEPKPSPSASPTAKPQG
jgi:hypothetical protein